MLYLLCVYFPPNNGIISHDSSQKQESEKANYNNVFQMHLIIKRSFLKTNFPKIALTR